MSDEASLPSVDEAIARRIESEREYHRCHYKRIDSPLLVNFDLAARVKRRLACKKLAYYDTISNRPIFWMRVTVAVLMLAGVCAASSGRPQQGDACVRCGWTPPRTSGTVVVRTIAELRRAVSRARAESTILLEDGIYDLAGATLDVPVRGLVLRGKNGQQSRVLLRGRGMDERMVAITVAAPNVTVADLTIRHVGFHGIQVRGEAGADGIAIHHVRIVDTGQQLIKVSKSPTSKPCRNGLVACSTLEYTDSAPSDYTNGVDVLNGENWVVRDNVLRKIRGPRSQGYKSGPSILFWGGSSGTIVERNLLIDCYRGIALGLMPGPVDEGRRLDHKGGTIRRNALCNLDTRADEPIEVNASPGVLVEHNTVMVEGKNPWSISIRFPTANAVVRNNLTRHPIVLRDGAKADRQANIANARPDWFVDPRRGDLRLARPDLPAVDSGILVESSEAKRNGGEPSFSGKAPDVGAYEFGGAR